ncbi:MAG: hypothetical protein KKH12_16260 [Gammaproteobacteria bacterium]|nr:hypothetical protein [Gammaproteobacteria bacterium]
MTTYFTARISRIKAASSEAAKRLVFDEVLDDIDLCLGFLGLPASVRHALNVAIYRARYVGFELALERISQIWGVAACGDDVGEDPAAHLEALRMEVRRERALAARHVGNELSRQDKWEEALVGDVPLEVERLQAADARQSWAERSRHEHRLEMARRAGEARLRRGEELRQRALVAQMAASRVKERAPTDAAKLRAANRDRLKAWVHQINAWAIASGSSLTAASQALFNSAARLTRLRNGRGWPTAEEQDVVFEVVGAHHLGECLTMEDVQ